MEDGPSFVSLVKKPSTALIKEAEVGAVNDQPQRFTSAVIRDTRRSAVRRRTGGSAAAEIHHLP